MSNLKIIYNAGMTSIDNDDITYTHIKNISIGGGVLTLPLHLDHKGDEIKAACDQIANGINHLQCILTEQTKHEQ